MTVVSRLVGKAMKLPAAQSHAIKVERNLKVPMPDGVVLLADRYIPAGGGPLVLVRSPYGRSNLFGTLFGTLFAERGLQVLLQSCRGTFGSQGRFDPFAERDDGLATVAWMREQDWYPGSFATAGPSYLGMVQWAIAGEVGSELKAMAALVTTSDPQATIFERRLVFAGDQPGLDQHGGESRAAVRAASAAIGESQAPAAVRELAA